MFDEYTKYSNTYNPTYYSPRLSVLARLLEMDDAKARASSVVWGLRGAPTEDIEFYLLELAETQDSFGLDKLVNRVLKSLWYRI